MTQPPTIPLFRKEVERVNGKLLVGALVVAWIVLGLFAGTRAFSATPTPKQETEARCAQISGFNKEACLSVARGLDALNFDRVNEFCSWFSPRYMREASGQAKWKDGYELCVTFYQTQAGQRIDYEIGWVSAVKTKARVRTRINDTWLVTNLVRVGKNYRYDGTSPDRKPPAEPKEPGGL